MLKDIKMTLKTKVSAQDVTNAIERIDFSTVDSTSTSITVCTISLKNGASDARLSFIKRIKAQEPFPGLL